MIAGYFQDSQDSLKLPAPLADGATSGESDKEELEDRKGNNHDNIDLRKTKLLKNFEVCQSVNL